MLPEPEHRSGGAPPPAPSPALRHNVTLRDAVALEAIVATAYAGALIITSSSSDGLAAAAGRSWLEFSRGFVDVVVWRAPLSPQHDEMPGVREGLFVYRNVLVFSLVIATVFFLSFQQHWTRWRLDLEAVLQRKAWPARNVRQLADVGYHQLIWGAVAVVLLLLFGDGALVRLHPGLYDVAWMHLRAPLLTSLAFAFACHAAVFAQLRR